MILVLGGTLEGREIAFLLYGKGYDVLLTVVSSHGAAMVPPGTPIEVLVGELDGPSLKQLVLDRQAKVIVDATHPYAAVISENALRVGKDTGIPYIRFERKQAALDVESSRIRRVSDYQDAARLAFGLGNIVFLTIGSKNIVPFITEGRKTEKRVIARVLPDPVVIRQCFDSGLKTKDIIAVQGPFSEEMNAAMLKEYKAEVLVTKDSGSTGGTDTKLAAASRLDLPVILISRPGIGIAPQENTLLVEDIDQVLKQISLIYPNS